MLSKRISNLPAPTDRRLDGKSVLVTGAGSSGEGFGTGKAISVLAAREGARLVLVDADPGRAEETRSLIEELGGTALVVEADVTRSADCERAVTAARDAFGGLDVLVNNIGISRVGTVVDLPEADWDAVSYVNVKAMFLMCKHAVPLMMQSGGGAIVNISSIGAILPNTTTPLSAYSASKGAVEALTRAIAVEHGAEGIRANTVAPGPIFTPRQVNRGLASETRERRRKLALTETEGTAWDVAWAVVFLASDQARWIDGAVLPVDGGVSIRGHSYR